MSRMFAVGKNALAVCDRCGQQVKLRTLKALVVNLQETGMKVCKDCWEPDHPQNMLGRYPVDDPQALRNPRPDTGKTASREIQWGWNPVGYYDPFGTVKNRLQVTMQLGQVRVQT